MLAAALRDGTAHRRTTFEVFARRLPEGRRYGVVAGTARFVEALAQFTFDDTALASLSDFLDSETLAYLADYRFRGDVDGYAEGELYFPGSPVLAVHGTFAECVCWRRWHCRSSTTTPRSRRPRPGWSSAAEGRPSSRWARGAPTSRPPWPRPGRLPRRVHRLVQPRGSATLRRARAGHERPRVHAAAHRRGREDPTRRRRFAPRSTRSASAPPCSSTPTTSPGRRQRRRGGGPRAGRGPHRLR